MLDKKEKPRMIFAKFFKDILSARIEHKQMSRHDLFVIVSTPKGHFIINENQLEIT